MLPMQEMGNQTSSFLVMGYTGQYHFSPSHHQRGVGSHPHRGFETVTIVYEGELEHFDSKGNHGSIAKDEVQWMTAGRGIMHEEHHSKDFAKTGGNLDMVQLWVNLPSHAKMTEPRYQELTTANIAEVKLAQNAGVVRVIAGQFEDTLGAAETFSPMNNVLDVRLNANAEQEFSFNPQWNNMIFVLSGAIEIEGQRFDAKQTLYVSDQVSSLKLKSFETTKLLILSGEALNEPIAAHGPFVMNTEDEIRQAFYDFQHGHFA
ncbi:MULTISPECIES: pirin family protein [unclassified Acinetobacter]|uniref:pirin family protein n=1 Tax=unclassified Acinetobacter TaxID=196816 RepID=UPI00211EF848|nr:MULTISPECIES: pirin family protein [unclassified Acinetobacter]